MRRGGARREGSGLSSSPPLPGIGGDTQSQKKSPAAPNVECVIPRPGSRCTAALCNSGTHADTGAWPRGEAGAREGGKSLVAIQANVTRRRGAAFAGWPGSVSAPRGLQARAIKRPASSVIAAGLEAGRG